MYHDDSIYVYIMKGFHPIFFLFGAFLQLLGSVKLWFSSNLIIFHSLLQVFFSHPLLFSFGIFKCMYIRPLEIVSELNSALFFSFFLFDLLSKSFYYCMFKFTNHFVCPNPNQCIFSPQIFWFSAVNVHLRVFLISSVSAFNKLKHYYFLKIWNSAIITILMSLPTNYINYVISRQFWSTVFSPHYGPYFPASLHAWNFSWILDNVGLTLLSAEYFYIPVNNYP